MQLSVNGKQLDVGEALRTHIHDSLSRILDKYFGDAIEVIVTMSREGPRYRAQISSHVGRHISMQSQGEAGEPYPAFDSAAERLSKRLRRYKRRLRDHHKEIGDSETSPAQQYILAAANDYDDTEIETVDGESGAGEQPVVVAELATEIANLTVGEAVMRMDLAEQPALLFRNRSHGGLNMVYRREDGNIGWIDPRGERND